MFPFEKVSLKALSKGPWILSSLQFQEIAECPGDATV